MRADANTRRWADQFEPRGLRPLSIASDANTEAGAVAALSQRGQGSVSAQEALQSLRETMLEPLKAMRTEITQMLATMDQNAQLKHQHACTLVKLADAALKTKAEGCSIAHSSTKAAYESEAEAFTQRSENLRKISAATGDAREALPISVSRFNHSLGEIQTLLEQSDQAKTPEAALAEIRQKIMLVGNWLNPGQDILPSRVNELSTSCSNKLGEWRKTFVLAGEAKAQFDAAVDQWKKVNTRHFSSEQNRILSGTAYNQWAKQAVALVDATRAAGVPAR